MTKPLTWFQVARRPKWVGGFFSAMAVAAICALLAQWQGGRAIEEPLHDHSSYVSEMAKAPNIDSVVRPGFAPRNDAVGTVVRATLTLDPARAWVVANRVQRDGTAGYWVVAIGRTDAGRDLVITLGFAAKRADANRARAAFEALPQQSAKQYFGRLSPSEGPQLIHHGLLKSLAVGQLANLGVAGQSDLVYPLFLLETQHAFSGLQKITVETLSSAQINWLSAFYALEWTFFMGFSFFMWWRLVTDAQLRELEGL